MNFNSLTYNLPKWSDILKILDHLLQDFQSVPAHPRKLCIMGLEFGSDTIHTNQIKSLKFLSKRGHFDLT